MTQEELKQYLREHLSIAVVNEYECDSKILEISLYLDDEKISSDYGYIK